MKKKIIIILLSILIVISSGYTILFFSKYKNVLNKESYIQLVEKATFNMEEKREDSVWLKYDGMNYNARSIRFNSKSSQIFVTSSKQNENDYIQFIRYIENEQGKNFESIGEVKEPENNSFEVMYNNFVKFDLDYSKANLKLKMSNISLNDKKQSIEAVFTFNKDYKVNIEFPLLDFNLELTEIVVKSVKYQNDYSNLDGKNFNLEITAKSNNKDVWIYQSCENI